MLAQNDERFRKPINQYGCYYFALAWLAWRDNCFPLDVEMLDEELYLSFQKHGWMSDTCFVKDPVALLRFMRMPVYHVWKRPASYKPRADEWSIGQFKADGELSHFVPVDEQGRVLYDSWWSKEGGSRAVREGKLISWRVFR